MDFQTRARLADADVWAVLLQQVGTLTEPNDIEGVISGVMSAVVRLVHRTQAEPDAATTVTIIREMAEKLAAQQDAPK